MQYFKGGRFNGSLVSQTAQ